MTLPTTRSRTLRAERRAAHRGVTLLELIVVMAIMAVLFGIGVGAFRSLARPEQLALSRIKQAVRSASLFARREGAPATVEVNPIENEVRSLGLRTVGNWHFEDDAGTGWPLDAVYEPDRLLRAGVVGSALRLSGDEVLTIPRPPPSFDSPYGFGIDVSLRPESSPRPMVLLERQGLWSLGLDIDDQLVLTLQLARDDPNAGPGVDELRHVIPDVDLPADRFTQLSLLFDGRAVTVSLDGARVGEPLVFDSLRRLTLNPNVSVSTGKPPQHLQGDIDELRLLSVIAAEPDLLPDEVELVGPPRLVHIDGAGRLDPAWHRTPVTITIAHGDPERATTVEVGLLGTLRGFTEEGKPADDRLQEERQAAAKEAARREAEAKRAL